MPQFRFQHFASQRLSAGFIRGLLNSQDIVWLHFTYVFRFFRHYHAFALRAFAPMFCDVPQRLPITRPPGCNLSRAYRDAASEFAPFRI
mgnify:CR=1 FL=1